jgi:hypothetical protein
MAEQAHCLVEGEEEEEGAWFVGAEHGRGSSAAHGAGGGSGDDRIKGGGGSSGSRSRVCIFLRYELALESPIHLTILLLLANLIYIFILKI